MTKPTEKQMEAARATVCWKCSQGEPVVVWVRRAWRSEISEWQYQGHGPTPSIDGVDADWCDAGDIEDIAQAIADAVVEERERCARIADQAALRQWSATTTQTAEAISKLIRKGIDK